MRLSDTDVAAVFNCPAATLDFLVLTSSSRPVAGSTRVRAVLHVDLQCEQVDVQPAPGLRINHLPRPYWQKLEYRWRLFLQSDERAPDSACSKWRYVLGVVSCESTARRRLRYSISALMLQ